VYARSQVISVCNIERIITIGQYLPKLRSNEKGSSFLTHRVGLFSYLLLCLPAAIQHIITSSILQRNMISSNVSFLNVKKERLNGLFNGGLLKHFSKAFGYKMDYVGCRI